LKTRELLSGKGHPEKTPARSPARILLGFCLSIIALVLVLQWRYLKSHPPDYLYQVGLIEDVTSESITGRARLRGQSDTAVEVEIYDGETHLATVVADQFRQDLTVLQLRNLRHGFRCPTPQVLKDGKGHTIRVKVAGTNYELAGSRREVTLERAHQAPFPVKNER
jgi:hypothetical protein